MKKHINIISLSIMLITAILGYIYIRSNYTEKKSNVSEVNQIQGLNIYTDANPILEFEQLGAVQVDSTEIIDEEYSNIRAVLIKKAKQDYPTAEGIIIYPENKKAFVIKFNK